MSFEDRWSYEFSIVKRGLPLLGIALIIGAVCTGLQLFHHYIGLPQWFIDGLRMPTPR